ncbi:MAG: hypothetical protein K9J16_15295 [Melioribacteraceae bacterium]|nr:hypothetical protein [Melioribacteraceae bacterium]MCF8355061.1 hypothetical protein [Melioribacteraceae bacterium]MCF8395642.1 hypothetical protein [Melioribacteraceae bacterium]
MNSSKFDSKKRLIFVFLLFVISIVFIDIIFSHEGNNNKNTSDEISPLQIDAGLLKNCDIIFRRGLSIVSEIVLTADNNSPYSHVGLLIIKNDSHYVIHAVPDESESGIDYLKKEKLTEFLRTDRADNYGVYRVDENFDEKVVSNFADDLVKNRVLFDDSFDLLNSEKYYCTELIYNCFKAAGLDITNGKLDTLFVPIGKNPFLLPGTLIGSPKVKLVTTSYHKTRSKK